jgi:serine/threonine protein kinase
MNDNGKATTHVYTGEPGTAVLDALEGAVDSIDAGEGEKLDPTQLIERLNGSGCSLEQTTAYLDYPSAAGWLATCSTPAYLAPEVFRGEPAGPLADLYALACTAYHLLTGGAPYTGTHWVAVMNHHVSTPMPDPRVVVADMAHYSRFIMDTLLKHPSVQDCKTSFVLDRVKATTALPV